MATVKTKRLPENATLGEWVQHHRLARGWSEEELASHCYVGESEWSDEEITWFESNPNIPVACLTAERVRIIERGGRCTHHTVRALARCLFRGRSINKADRDFVKELVAQGLAQRVGEVIL